MGRERNREKEGATERYTSKERVVREREWKREQERKKERISELLDY